MISIEIKNLGIMIMNSMFKQKRINKNRQRDNKDLISQLEKKLILKKKYNLIRLKNQWKLNKINNNYNNNNNNQQKCYQKLIY